jgi:hypothetical protein
VMEEQFMLGLTALDLARFQFGFTVSFHILLPLLNSQWVG